MWVRIRIRVRIGKYVKQGNALLVLMSCVVVMVVWGRWWWWWLGEVADI